ncbi:MAG: patatin-like phospholipase family protein, partial [Candidatus Melainabacteria bacterium]|nr:patatin-like phospholipase family protein [Candidatus Melainabacteria bacterium]
IGAWYCAGVPLETIEKWMLDGTISRAFMPIPIWLKVFLNVLNSAVFAWHNHPYPGIFSGKKIASLVNRAVSPSLCKIENLPVRFAAIATNLINGQSEQISTGNLGQAVQASCSWPPLYRPVIVGKATYADGGIQSNLPAAWARDSGAEVVIVIDVDEDLRNVEPHTLKSLTGLASRVSTIVVSTMDQYHTTNNDIVIKPDVTGILLLAKDTDSLKRAIAAGEHAATEALPKIKRQLSTMDNTTY